MKRTFRSMLVENQLTVPDALVVALVAMQVANGNLGAFGTIGALLVGFLMSGTLSMVVEVLLEDKAHEDE